MRRHTLLIPLIVLVHAACDDPFGPRDWNATPDTVVLFSASRPELLGRPSGYDLINLSRVVIERLGATGFWDFVFAEVDETRVLVPASAFPGVASRAAIARVEAASLEEIVEAPGDTAAFRSEPVVIEPGAFYVVRTRREFCGELGTVGIRYAKLEALEIDEVAGTFRFAVVRNPFCNTRALVPPDES